MLKPIARNNIGDTVFAEMMNMFATGQWKVGDKIPSENELKDTFQVSRNTVRQTIQRIGALGVLESKQGEGTFVKKLDSSFYINAIVPSALLSAGNPLSIMEFQKGIQIECVKLAALRRTDQQMTELFGMVEKMREFRYVQEKYLEHDIAYHCLIAEMTNNELFTKCMDILRFLLYHTLKDIVDNFDNSVSIDFHNQIGNAIKAKDVELSGALMEAHMKDVIAKMSKIVGVRP